MLALLDKLRDRITALRAAFLDNLDAALSGIPAASDYTSTLAGRIDAAISSRLAGSVIQSIQYGVISMSGVTSNTATISSVTTSKCLLICTGMASTDSTGNGTRTMGYLTLTNSTTITATRNDATNALDVSYALVEFK